MMSSQTLKDALLENTLAASEAEAIANLVAAYGDFAMGAVAGVIPILAPGVALGKVAMSTVLVGMNASGAAASKIALGATAFWTAVALGLTTSFAGATTIVPPPHVNMAQELEDVFQENILYSRSAEDALGAVAEIMYNNATTGGSVTVVTPTYDIS